MITEGTVTCKYAVIRGVIKITVQDEQHLVNEKQQDTAAVCVNLSRQLLLVSSKVIRCLTQQ